MEGFVTIFHLMMYFLVLSTVLHTEKWWDRFWNVSLAASFIMSCYGLLQLAGKITINQGGVRLDGTFGNSAYLAIYLVIHFFLALLFVFRNKDSNLKWMYGFVALLNVLTLYFTATRGAIIGLFGGLFITTLIIAFKERENSKVKKVSRLALIFLVAVILVFISFRKVYFVQQSPVLSRFANISFSEIKNQGRYFVWPMAIEGVKERPILGWGQENFNYVFNKNYNPLMYNQERWFDRTHNVFLDWLIAGGILGLASYLFMYVALLIYLKRNKKINLTEKAIFVGLLSAYFFHNIFVFDNLISYILFFSVLAYIHHISSDHLPRLWKKEFSNDAFNYGFMPLGVIVLVAMIYFVNIPPMNQAKTLIKAISPQKEGVSKNFEYFQKTFAYNSFGQGEALEQLISATSQIASANIPPDAKSKFFELTKVEGENKLKETPKDARYLLMYGSFLNRTGDYENAIPYLDRAIANSPRNPMMYFELGSSYIGKRDYQKGFETLEYAYNLEPRYQDAGLLYVVGAIYAKRTDVLTKILPAIDKNTFLTDNRILRAYVDIKDYNTAINILNERLKFNPKDLNTNLSLAGVYAESGNKGKAIEILRQIVSDNPNFKDQGEYYIKQLSQ
jgi:O-antigen ligase/tetratricopeptide (TPR) repeat protein